MLWSKRLGGTTKPSRVRERAKNSVALMLTFPSLAIASLKLPSPVLAPISQNYPGAPVRAPTHGPVTIPIRTAAPLYPLARPFSPLLTLAQRCKTAITRRAQAHREA